MLSGVEDAVLNAGIPPSRVMVFNRPTNRAQFDELGTGTNDAHPINDGTLGSNCGRGHQ